MIKIRKKEIFRFFAAVIMLPTLFLVCQILQVPPEYRLFFINMALLVLIIAKAQFSLVSIWAILINYVLLNVFVYFVTGSGYGLLNYIQNLYIIDMNALILTANISVLLWVYLSPFLKYEKELMSCRVDVSKNTCIFLCVIAVAAAYIAFPRFQFGFQGSARFVSLLPGHAWNHLAMAALIFASAKIRESHMVQALTAAALLWILAHAERVDVLGFITFLMLSFCILKKYSIRFGLIVRYGIVIAGLFAVMSYIGEKRNGYNEAINIGVLAGRLVSQNTASDVGYVFHSSIDLVKNGGLLNGKTYLTYLQGILPLMDQPYRAELIMQKLYHTVGGEFILTEPMINFGYPGVVILPNLYILLVYRLIKKKSVYRYYIYAFLIASSYRYIWYGLSYIETALIYFFPFLWFAGGILERRRLRFQAPACDGIAES